ncbi:MAG: hypothetical protein GX639_12485 [Fibrobacter sp.]|nr:hypothetical protein [Fibrobacter sp.]
MKRLTFKVLSAVSLSALLAFNLQCGGMNQKKLADVENRIKTLTAKGVPDSVIVDTKLYIVNYTTAKKLYKSNDAAKYADSIMIGIELAEKWYSDFIAANKANILNSITSFNAEKTKLTGMQLRAADSIGTIIDSLVKRDLIVDAQDKVKEALAILPSILKDQQKASKIKPLLTGTWKDVHKVADPETSQNYTETSVYTFKGDGSFEGSESRKGQSTPFMKEDWEFLSTGTFDLKGDTICLFVTREKCTRQKFTHLDSKTNKWIEKTGALYDSTITNHGKDKYIPYEYFKANFKKSK